MEPFLNGIPDLSTIHCSSQVIQSLAFIAGYSTHQYLKRSQNCGICINFLTIDKTLFIEGLCFVRNGPPADLDRGSISDKYYFAWQKWTPLSITLPFVFKFKFDNAIENNVILGFKLLELTDLGSLKYPSEPVLESILTLWKLFSAIENDRQLMTLLVDGPARNILVELSIIYIENSCYSELS